MAQESVTEAVWEFAHKLKAQLHEETPHSIAVLRDGVVVAALSSTDLGRLLGLAGVARAGYGADALAAVVEGVMPIVPRNPVTGEPWQPGEAESLWLHDEGARLGWVSEVAMVVIAGRDGSSAQEGWAFRHTDAGLEWADAPRPLSGTGLLGPLAMAFERPAPDPARVPDPGEGFHVDPVDGPFYPPQWGRLVLDIGCTRILAQQLPDGDAWMFVDDEARADVLIDAGLPSWQIEIR